MGILCKTDAGYAALRDVETKEKTDRMESFFLAETLKYEYLLFAAPETLDLKKSFLIPRRIRSGGRGRAI